MLWVIVLVVVLVLVGLFLLLTYNRLVRYRNRSENAWAQVDVQLKRRADLIPNLVETVKGYAAHERETFDEVTRARAALQQAQTPAEYGCNSHQLGEMRQEARPANSQLAWSDSKCDPGADR